MTVVNSFDPCRLMEYKGDPYANFLYSCSFRTMRYGLGKIGWVSEGFPEADNGWLILDKRTRIKEFSAFAVIADQNIDRDISIAFLRSVFRCLIDDPGSVTTAKDNDQDFKLLTETNVRSMISRLDPRSYANSRFYFHPELMSHIIDLGVNVAQYRKKVTSGEPDVTLCGFPCYSCDCFQTPGLWGDIVLIDPTRTRIILNCKYDSEERVASVDFNPDDGIFQFKSHLVMVPPRLPLHKKYAKSGFITLADRL